MATCSPSDLVTAGKCFLALPANQRQAIIAVLLCRILQAYNPVATCDINSLMADAKCFAALPPNQLQAIQTQLLCEILQGGGGSGQTCIVCIDEGEDLPDPAPCDCTIAYDRVGHVWAWNSVTVSWFEVIV